MFALTLFLPVVPTDRRQHSCGFWLCFLKIGSFQAFNEMAEMSSQEEGFVFVAPKSKDKLTYDTSHTQFHGNNDTKKGSRCVLVSAWSFIDYLTQFLNSIDLNQVSSRIWLCIPPLLSRLEGKVQTVGPK